MAFSAVVLTITGATGCALAAVVVPSEEHKWTLAAILSLWGVKVWEGDLWRKLPKGVLEDESMFKFIYAQVRVHVMALSWQCQAWLTLLLLSH